MSYRIIEGDALERLRELDAGSVQTCITSPPYWGLRDYGTAAWDGGDPECDHLAGPLASDKNTLGGGKGQVGDGYKVQAFGSPFLGDCGKCGATRIDSQLGLEPTPEQYVANLVAVFREVRRVLRDDGTVWLNLGDSYYSATATQGRNENRSTISTLADHGPDGRSPTLDTQQSTTYRRDAAGIKAKDLVGIPWVVAFALRADGWWLRSDIVWAKPNPMPESVTDRPTRSHEYLFLLTKSARYFYDADAIREDGVSPEQTAHNERYAHEYQAHTERTLRGEGIQPGNNGNQGIHSRPGPGGRNKRSVWEIATQPFAQAHFATFPPKLIEPCVLAGSPPKCCGECGAPWERVVERSPMVVREGPGRQGAMDAAVGASTRTQITGTMLEPASTQTVGWRSICTHDDDTGRSLILDPFAGAGTTGVVALRHDRDFVGIELNPDYARMARNRIHDDAPLLNVEVA